MSFRNLDLRQVMPGPYEFRPDQYDADEVLKLWPQAAAELAGFADYLGENNGSITAGQIRMALWLAHHHFRLIEATQ
jgi:hypothetical protein